MQQSFLMSESAPVAEGRIYYHPYPCYISVGWTTGCFGVSERGVFACSSTKMNCCKDDSEDDMRKYSNRDPSAVWLFEPVAGRTNTFYLRNKKYDYEQKLKDDEF